MPPRDARGLPLSPKSLQRALTVVGASDEQRARVLGSFETSQPKMSELRDEAFYLNEQIHELDPRAPDYLKQADAFTARVAEANAEQTRIRSRFVHDVATILTQKQWDRWLEFFRLPAEQRYEGPTLERR